MYHMRPAISTFIAFTILTGVLYPVIVTGIAQSLFPYQANGSLIRANNQTLGSELIGQQFTNPKYFWGRVSATAPAPYNAAASSGSNLGPSNAALIVAVKNRIEALKKHTTPEGPVPIDLVTSSASGLDPHITPAAAEYQIPRIAEIRGMRYKKVRELVGRSTQSRRFRLLAEPRVNVLHLNLALDGKSTSGQSLDD